MDTQVEVPAPLARHVESISVHGPSGVGLPYRVLPGLGAVAGFQFCGRLRVEREGTSRRLARSGISGVQRVARQFVPEGAVGSVLVRFTPWGAYGLLGCGLHELTDQQAALEEAAAGAREAQSRVEEGGAENAARAVVAWLMALYERRRREAHGEVVEAVRRVVASRGSEPVERIASRLLVGRRQLERLFREQVGVGPKEFASLARLGWVVEQAKRQRGWAGVAAAAGYADQAHFHRSFKARVGMTPAAYWRERSGGR
jgi:AraC-like DNA-binding protein